jgi:hypothetical protein
MQGWGFPFIARRKNNISQISENIKREFLIIWKRTWGCDTVCSNFQVALELLSEDTENLFDCWCSPADTLWDILWGIFIHFCGRNLNQFVVIIYFNCKWVFTGGSGTTIRHNTQTTHITQNNTTLKRNTAHKTTHTINTLHRMKIEQSQLQLYKVVLIKIIML